MNKEIRTAFDSGFDDMQYGMPKFVKRSFLKLGNFAEAVGSARAAHHLEIQGYFKEAEHVRTTHARSARARSRLLDRLG